MNQLGALNFQNVGSIGQGMGQYQNQFTEQVIGNAQNDIFRQNQMQQQQNRASAAHSGAFGGSRHGVLESLTNEASARAMGDIGAQLRSQGFNTAAQLSGQDINNQMAAGSGLMQAGQGAGALGAAGFNMGQSINQDMSQQGMLQQALQQQILNQAGGMFSGYVDQPLNLLNMRNAAASGSPLNAAVSQTQTTQNNPGALGILSGIMGLGSGMGKAGKK